MMTDVSDANDQRQVSAGIVWGIAALCGTIFSVGLTLSGMTDRAKVLAFLDVQGDWNPALLWVMVSALLAAAPAIQWAQRRSAPLLARQFVLPEQSRIDRQLLIGAMIFGIGWGLYGLCPGPAIALLLYAQLDTVLFILAMLVGMWLANRWPVASE